MQLHGPNFHPCRRGATRRRSRRRVGLPTALPTRGMASWIQNLDFLTNERQEQTDAHKSPLWDRPDAAANRR